MNSDARCRSWFEKYPKLYQVQTDILKSAGFVLNEDALKNSGRVEFLGSSKIDPERRLRVVFPTAFPSSAPKIFDFPPSKLLARHHRAHDRQLCLFGFDEIRWSATLTVAAALKETEELISLFKAGNAFNAEEQPPEPMSLGVNLKPNAAILIPPPISTFSDFEIDKLAQGWFILHFVHQVDAKKDTVGRGIITKAGFGKIQLECAHPFSDLPESKGKQYNGRWFYLPVQPSAADVDNLLNECFLKCKSSGNASSYWFALVFSEETGKIGRSRLTWLIVRANFEGKFHKIRTFAYIQSERFSRIPGLEGLEEKTVTIVGCGSLGSKIAANLAATGISRLHLIDPDYYEPNNAVRHELGIEFFGLPKAHSLINRLVSLNPLAANQIKAFPFFVASTSDFKDEKAFFDLVKESHLIIEATGKHYVRHYINELAFELNIPALSASVTNGAWAGEVIRTVPGRTPCWLCWLDQYYEQMPSSAPKQEGEVFAPGCDQPTFTGTTYDLGIVANLATSMAVETLLADKSKTDFSKNYIRWSRNDKDGKPLFLTEVLSTTSQQECCLCGR